MTGLNSDLLQMAINSVKGSIKAGFVPSDVTAGGQPPPDVGPGGAPGGAPGAMPPDAGLPPDAGAPPPPDPSAGGVPPMLPPPPPDPTGGGMDPTSIAGQVSMGVSNALAQSGLQGNKGVGPGGKPTVKPDINTIATDVFQLKKMLFSVMRHAGIELPPDVLDGPNRDPMTGALAESPAGGSDVPPGASMQPGAIKPIQPIQPALPTPGGKMASAVEPEFTQHMGREIKGADVLSKAAAVALMCRRRNGRV